MAPLAEPAPSHRRLGWRTATAGLAAALLLTFLVGTDQGRTAAAQFLAQFRSQRFAVVTVDSAWNWNSLGQLERLGTVERGQRGRTGEAVRSLAEAAQRVGFPLAQPDAAALPPGLNPTPQIMVSPSREVRFTFDEAKARAYLQANGQAGVNLPSRFHGASLVVAVPAAALLQYSGTNGAQLLIGQARELAVGTEGAVTLEEMRDVLLGLPGLPPETVRQLRAIQDWRNTLPLPVPADAVSWQGTTVACIPGLLLTDQVGVGSAELWQRDGRVYGVAGTPRPTEIQRVANSLR